MNDEPTHCGRVPAVSLPETVTATTAILSARARAALVDSATALTIAELAVKTGRGVAEMRRWVGDRREESRLVAVTLADGTVLVPVVQFDEVMELDERVADRTQRLVAFGMDSWAIWDWWQVPNGWLGVPPAAMAAAGDFAAVDEALDGLMQ